MLKRFFNFLSNMSKFKREKINTIYTLYCILLQSMTVESQFLTNRENNVLDVG